MRSLAHSTALHAGQGPRTSPSHCHRCSRLLLLLACASCSRRLFIGTPKEPKATMAPATVTAPTTGSVMVCPPARLGESTGAQRASQILEVCLLLPESVTEARHLCTAPAQRTIMQTRLHHRAAHL